MISPGDRKRVVWLYLGLIFLFSILIIQYYRIQIVEGKKWTAIADRQHYFFIKDPFIRGSFYSNGSLRKDGPEDPVKLVVDIQKFHLFADPKSLPDNRKSDIAKRLIALLKVPEKEQASFRSNFYKKSRNRRLSMWIEKEDQEKILAWWEPYARKQRIPKNALYFTADYQRSYPYGKLLGHVLHTVQSVRDEKTMQPTPTGGLESYFNPVLKGKPGKRRLMRSPRNALETGEVISEPENGADIYLTINHYLQAVAEEELEKGVKNCQAKAGWAVMMDPKTGEILAMAQYPFFYPAQYSTYFNDPLKVLETRAASITDANEPGSVMKAITVAMGLLANKTLIAQGKKPVFDPQEKTACSNPHFEGRKPLKDTHFHKYLNMDMAIQKSSNIYVARLLLKIIDQLGEVWCKKVLHEVFGFGEKTGIEFPYESRGLVPTPGKKHPNGTLEWSKATPPSLAMGHNILATPIQLVRAMAVFANGGYLVKPTLVRQVVKTEPDGTKKVLLDNTERWKTAPRVLDRAIAERVTHSMKFTTKPGGTARKGDICGYSVVGKTGTAQKIIGGRYSDTQYCSSFLGFAPTKDPAFVLVVTMDEPKYCYVPGVGKMYMGGTCAAPVFREIGRRTLEYLGVTPDDPHGYPKGDPRHNPAKADNAEELKKLQDLYQKWND